MMPLTTKKLINLERTRIFQEPSDSKSQSCGMVRQACLHLTMTLSLAKILLCITGCQPFAARANLSDQDDWEAPARNSYSMPRQFASPYNKRNNPNSRSQPNQAKEAQASEPAASPAGKPSASQSDKSLQDPSPEVSSTKAAPETSDKAVAPVPANNAANSTPPIAKDAIAANPSDTQSIADTGATDLDLDTAIAALPAHLQEVFRSQLLATMGKKNTNESSVQLASYQPAESGSPRSAEQVASSQSSDSQSKSPAIKLSLSDRTQGSSNETIQQRNALVTNAHSQAVTASHVQPQEPVSSSSVVDAERIQPVVSTSSPATAIGANTPATDIEPVQTASAVTSVERRVAWNQSLAQSASALSDELKSNSSMDQRLRFKYELALRLLHLANHDLDQALEPIEGMQKAEQEYFRYQLQALFDSTNPEASPVASRRWALVMENQRIANRHLASISNLEIRNSSFCTDVQGYGSTTPFQSRLFKPDQDVLLYCELENITAEEVRNGFETQLQGSYEIVDSRGNRIADQLLPMEKEICSNYRRDYFVVYRIFMPLQIAPGNYEMRVTIEDMKGKKFGQTALEFQIQK